MTLRLLARQNARRTVLFHALALAILYVVAYPIQASSLSAPKVGTQCSDRLTCGGASSLFRPLDHSWRLVSPSGSHSAVSRLERPPPSPREVIPAHLHGAPTPSSADQGLEILALFLDDDTLKALGLPRYPATLPTGNPQTLEASGPPLTPMLLLLSSLAALLLVSRTRRQYN